MGKISPVSAKYIIHATIAVEGIVDKPDVIGAVFGQTEGLLGNDLELRELQRSGRIGRIEVNVDTKGGKSQGTILIPSSLDKAETAIVGASLEIIQRIGPCNATIRVGKVEDVRISKRQQVISRAKELLRRLIDTSMPDSQELADEVAHSVRVMEICEFGKDRLPAGPAVEESEDIIVVEGRADVLTLLRYGIKNSIAINGTSVPKTIVDLCKKKTVTVFVDGDRGGDLIIKELQGVTDIDFVTKAPDGKEVEELTQKEILKALRSKVGPDQVTKSTAPARGRESNNGRFERRRESSSTNGRRDARPTRSTNNSRGPKRESRETREPRGAPAVVAARMTPDQKKAYGKMLEDLIGTRGAYVLDPELNILGKVPSSELDATIKSLGSGIHAIVFDGMVTPELVDTAQEVGVKCLVGMSNKAKSSRLQILTADDL
jgi:DNA primase